METEQIADDMIGRRFGRLTVLSRVQEPGKAKYVCRCDCGTIKIIRRSALKAGDSTSCGCFLREKNSMLHKRYHTETDKILAKRLSRINERCYCPTSSHYRDYGGRGIQVYPEWRADPAKFIAWAKTNGYKPGLSIDRIDVNGNYEPGNCRWVDNNVQQNNKRYNRNITVDDVTMTAAQWCDKLGINSHPIYGLSDSELEQLFANRILQDQYDSLPI